MISRIISVAVLASSLAVSVSAFAASPTVSFEDFNAGDDVTGPGTAHPSLEITPFPNSADSVLAVETGGSFPFVMGAPNCSFIGGLPTCPTGRLSFNNNCLEDVNGNRVDKNISGQTNAVGFANVTANEASVAHEFDFTFVGNVAASAFSIRVFDLGDFNPQAGTTHSIGLTARDSAGNVLDQDVFDWTSSTAGNPRADGSSVGDLAITGDACDANGPNSGQPGYLELSVSAPTGASTIELRQSGGPDPNIVFDSISFSACTRTIGYWKNHTWSGVTVEINGDQITELEGRSSPVDEKPGNGYLWQAKGKNFSMLYAQLIAAKLNCGGAGDCTPDESIADAEAFLLAQGVGESNLNSEFASNTQKRNAAELSTALDEFNNGIECQ